LGKVAIIGYMAERLKTSLVRVDERATISSRHIAQGREWQISDLICGAGPRDRPFEELHRRMSIATVISGTFHYRSNQGDALLYPGSLLLGNARTCFQCSHEHGIGDRCIAVSIDEELFNEVVASAAGSSRYRFDVPMLPAMPQLLPTIVQLQTLNEASRQLAAESLVSRIVESVSQHLSSNRSKPTRCSPRDKQRTAAVIRHIEANADAPLDLDVLSELANMSKYHFLRTFRHVTGQTPYQYVLAIRMRRAAFRLATSRVSVSTIAYDAGFGDLSTFNNRFRQLFGTTPSKYRVDS
jgi:AraC family transcriptional regulator